MKHEKEVGIWVKASDEKPAANLILPLRIDGKYFTGYIRDYGDKTFCVDARTYWNVHPNNVEWLKPIRDVFVLTQELEEIKNADKWISVEDALPKVSNDKEKFPVEAFTIIGVTAPVYYWGITKESDPCKGWSISGVTHWQPLPSPPKSITNGK